MGTEKENEFMKRLHEKNSRAFRELFMNFYKSLVCYAMGYVNEKEQAEDIVQELFMQIWESKTRYMSYMSFKTFLYTSVRNACLNLLKHKEVEDKYARYIQERESEVGEGGDLCVMEEEVYRLLLNAISELPPRCREVFEQVLAGKKNEEIAEMLKISILTVKAQKRIGTLELRKKLGNLYGIAILFFPIFN